MIHIAAATQIRLDTPGRAYYRRKLAAGSPARSDALPQEAHLRRAVPPAAAPTPPPGMDAGPGGHRGATLSPARPVSPAHRHFGSATSRTRTNDATRARTDAEDRRLEPAPTHPLTSEGCRSDAARVGVHRSSVRQACVSSERGARRRRRTNSACSAQSSGTDSACATSWRVQCSAMPPTKQCAPLASLRRRGPLVPLRAIRVSTFVTESQPPPPS